MRLDNSKDLLTRARKVIPSATQTFSKGPNQWAGGVSPNYLARGEGAWVWDADGNKYLDYLMALGPIILGYNNPGVTDAVARQLRDGVVFSQMHPLEVEVAELLVEIIPCAEMARFAKNGSDATAGAVRAARAYTGRDHVACSGYHGWQDWFIGTTTRDKGVPKAVAALTHVFRYNDLDGLKAVFERYPGEVAAVVMEPVGLEPPKAGFLEQVRELARAQGALLIFDEIVTGFRFGIGGAQAHFDVTPDLACFGKAMANGLPLSAIVGRRDVMRIFDEIFFSGTFSGETLSLAACKATIGEMQAGNVFEHLWSTGRQLFDGLSDLVERHGLNGAIKAAGYPVRSALTFPHEDEQQSRIRRSYFMQECVKRGLLYFGIHLPTFAHRQPELDFTFKVMGEVMPLFAAAYQANDFADRLEGPCVEPVFRRP